MAAKRFQTLYFELGGITKHLMTGPSGETVSFVSPRASMFPSASPRGTLRSRRNKTHCFPWDQSLSAYLYFEMTFSLPSPSSLLKFPRDLKQGPRRLREHHITISLISKNNSYGGPARAFYISIHFFAVLVLTTL